MCASIMLARLSAEVGEVQRANGGPNSPCNPGSGLFANRMGLSNKKYLPVTQAGFRKGRSTRDNSFALRTLVNLAIELGERLTVTSLGLDLRQAFDSVSHACMPRGSAEETKALTCSAQYILHVEGLSHDQSHRGRRHSATTTRVQHRGEGCCRATSYPLCTLS